MIVSKLSDAQRYSDLHPRFSEAFEFLRASASSSLEDGKHEIAGEDLFAVVWSGMGKGQAEAVLECHRLYVDVQYVVSGEDLIGWQSLSECERVKQKYDTATDLAFFFDRPRTWYRVPTGTAAILFPEDVHAPLGGTGSLKKIVVKVRIG